MSVVFAKEFLPLISSLEFSSPTEGETKKEYKSFLTYPSKVLLQTPPLRVSHIEEKNSYSFVYVEVDPRKHKDLYACIRGVENGFLNTLEENPSWIGSKSILHYTRLYDFFVSSFLMPTSLDSPFLLKLVVIPEETSLFDKGGKKIPLKRMKKGQSIVFLLDLAFILFHNQKIYLPTTVSQARIYDPPEKDPDLLIEFFSEEEEDA